MCIIIIICLENDHEWLNIIIATIIRMVLNRIEQHKKDGKNHKYHHWVRGKSQVSNKHKKYGGTPPLSTDTKNTGEHHHWVRTQKIRGKTTGGGVIVSFLRSLFSFSFTVLVVVSTIHFVHAATGLCPLVTVDTYVSFAARQSGTENNQVMSY